MPRKKKGKRGLQELVKTGAGIAGLIPGGAGVAKGLGAAAEVMKILGIRSAKAPAKRSKLAKAARQANMVPRTSLAPAASLPAFAGGRTPATYQRTMPAPNRKDGVRLCGCEGTSFSITTGAGVVLGQTTLGLSPAVAGLFPWLNSQSALWTKFYFRRIRMHFITNRGTTSGSENISVFSAYTPDAYIDAGFSTTDLSSIMALSQKQVTVMWQSHVLDIDLPQEGTEPYYLDADGNDNRLENQGNILYGQCGHTGAVGGDVTVYGQLFIEYDVDLFDRKLTTVTLEGEKLRRALMSRAVPEEVRRRAGIAYVEEILKAFPTRRPQRSKLELLLEDVDKLAPEAPRTGIAMPVAALCRR